MQKKGKGQKILGGVVAVWGAAVVANGLLRGASAGASESYQFGYSMGAVFGAILLIVGLYYLIKG
jgi:hypothetical protein